MIFFEQSKFISIKPAIKLFLISITFLSPYVVADTNNISILSWNVYFDDSTGDTRYPKIISTIRTQSPDIVCLQEVTNKFITHIESSNELSSYNLINTQGTKPYRNIILSKKEITKSGVIKIPTNMGRSAPYIEIKTKNSTIKIVNLHLDSMTNDTELRIKQLKTVLDYSEQQEKLILCGDFNFGEHDRENKFITNNFKDAGNNSNIKTYDIEKNQLANKTKFSFEKSRRLDRILTKGKISTHNYHVLTLPFSDHYPIISTIKK